MTRLEQSAPPMAPDARRGPTFVTEMGLTRLAIFTVSTAFAALVITKFVIGIPLPDPGHIIPIYIVVAGIDLLVIGLLCVDIRGLILTAMGLMLIAVGGVVALVDATGRTQALFFGFPLFTLGAAAAAMFGHGTLHARPSLVLWGARLSIYAVGGSAFAILYGLAVLIGREHLHGHPVARMALVAGALIAIAIAGAAVFRRGELLDKALEWIRRRGR